MSTVIKGGAIITADRTYEADVLIEGEKIAAIGENLKGDKTLDADGAYIMPGGIDPHTHLEMPFMGTTAAETWESGTFAALSGRHDACRRFCHSRPGRHARCAEGNGKPVRSGKRRPTIPFTCASPGGRKSTSKRWPKQSISASTPSSISWPIRAR